MVKHIGKAFAAFAVVLMVTSAPLAAHHSAAAEFDVTKEITLTGVLTKFELVNPHTWFYVDVTGPDGRVTSWRLEGLSPNGLIRQGLKTRDDFKLGGTYTFRIPPARKEPALGFLKAVTVNGKEYVVVEL